MECKNLHKKVIFFLEKELPAKEMEKFNLHLTNCKDCALFFNEMKLMLGIIEMEKSPEINPFFYTRLKAKLENQVEESQVFLWRPALIKLLQPAIFSLLLVIGIYAGIKIGQPNSPRLANNTLLGQEMIPYLNEMSDEPIEAFLME